MSNDNYGINVNAVEDMSDNIDSQAAEYIKVIEETTSIVDELGAHWEGATYQTFRDGYYAHLADLENLNNSLKTFSNQLYEEAQSARKTISEIKSIFGK